MPRLTPKLVHEGQGCESGKMTQRSVWTYTGRANMHWAGKQGGLLSCWGNYMFTKIWNPGTYQARRGVPGGVEKINHREIEWTVRDLSYQVKMTWFLIWSCSHFKTTNPLRLGTMTQKDKSRSWWLLVLCLGMTSGFTSVISCIFSHLIFH